MTTTTKPPTPAQLRAYRAILEHLLETGRTPTLAEIGARVGTTASMARYLVQPLALAGWIEYGGGGWRGVSVPQVADAMRAKAGELLSAMDAGKGGE